MKLCLVVNVFIVLSLEFCIGQYKNNKQQKRSTVVCSPDTFFQHPDPEDCTKFYKCDAAQKPVQFSCPSGLHYNAKIHVCDWPKDAGCQVGKENKDSNGAKDQKDIKKNNEKNKYPVECPAVKEGSTTRVKDPNDSKSFYVCNSDGVPTPKSCPPSTAYDDVTKKCKTEKSNKKQGNQSVTPEQNESSSAKTTNSDRSYNWDKHW